MDGGAVWLRRRLRGACYVLAEGRAVPSCIMTVEETAGKSLVTLEGLAINGTLHPVQRAFLDEDAMSCGYCTSGRLISAAALLAHTPHPSDGEIREALPPHLCRRGVYLRARSKQLRNELAQRQTLARVAA